MDIKELSERAIEIRAKYSELEKKKYGREWTRVEVMQGFIGDVGDLMKLVMAKEGIRKQEEIDEKMGHELADCLWSILVLAQKYDVDIESVFLKTMKELDDRIAKQTE